MAPEAAQRADLAIIRAQIATRQRTLFAVVQQRLQSLIGRQLISIDVRGLSGDAKRALLSRLPLHNGDALSLDNIEATTRSLRKFDERLEFVYSIVPEGATLTIHPPE